MMPINPATGHFGRPVHVADPYNLYFTPDGRYAVVMASALHEIVFRDPHTMHARKRVQVPCAGVNHADFTADGRRFLVSCEFSGALLEVNTSAQRVTKVVRLPGPGCRCRRTSSSRPRAGLLRRRHDAQRAVGGGRGVFWVAGRYDGVVYAISTRTGRLLHKITVGAGPHGLCIYPQPGRYSLGHTGVFR
jgi:DNA-binding beta-propeller fold protein YncE